MPFRSDAILFERPGHMAVRELELKDAAAGDILVAVEASGISTGTERLLFNGEMPAFPGMGYPLVPGYEAVGTVIDAGDVDGVRSGDRVFVPGSAGFADARGLFGASASHLRVQAGRVTKVSAELGADAVLLALAATAHRAVRAGGEAGLPELIVGHGVLGRLGARIVAALGGSPSVWEENADRRAGASHYTVLSRDEDARRDYTVVLDCSGDPSILDQVIPCMSRGGLVVLAGFYSRPIAFAFPPAFMRETRIVVSAEWQPADMTAVIDLVETGRLSLAGLVTHRAAPGRATDAYRTAFEDPSCLKMILEWGATQ